MNGRSHAARRATRVEDFRHSLADLRIMQTPTAVDSSQEAVMLSFTVNGKPRQVGVPPASAVAGRKVTTIEGLSEKGDHPVQRAWTEVDVPQCGYCQSGQIMSAAALLARKATPTDADID